MQLHGRSVNANVRQATARRENGLTDVEGGRKADGLDRDIYSGPFAKRRDDRTNVVDDADAFMAEAVTVGTSPFMM